MRWATAINKCRASCPKLNTLPLSPPESGNDLPRSEKQAAAEHVNETKGYTSSHHKAALQPRYYCRVISYQFFCDFSSEHLKIGRGFAIILKHPSAKGLSEPSRAAEPSVPRGCGTVSSVRQNSHRTGVGLQHEPRENAEIP